MSLEEIKRHLIDNIPKVVTSKGLADVLSILLEDRITYMPNMKSDKIYNCQSLFFKVPQPCKYRLNLKSITTEEIKTENIENIDFSEVVNVGFYQLPSTNNFFPFTDSAYKIYFTNDRLTKEVQRQYYPTILKTIKDYIQNITLIDATPYSGSNIINICELDNNAVVVAGEKDEMYYNGMVNNWKLFDLPNNHQFFRKSYKELLKDDKLLFTPNVLYYDISDLIEISKIEHLLLQSFPLVILKIKYNKLDDIKALKTPVQTLEINNGQMLVFLSNESKNRDQALYDKISTTYNLYHPPLPLEYFKNIGQKICLNPFVDIGKIIEENYPGSIKHQYNPIPILDKLQLDKLYSIELKRQELYNNIKLKINNLVGRIRRLEGPKLLLRYVFTLIIKRQKNDDPIFVASDLDFGTRVIHGDAKYFKLSKELTRELITLLKDEFLIASKEVQDFQNHLDENTLKTCPFTINELIKMRYEYLELATMGLAYPYAEKGYSRDDDVLECFSNPINRYFNNFCTAFPDLEAYVGSKGSFWNMTTFPYKKLVLNPPFDETVISEMFKKLMTILGNVGNIDVEIVIPNWSDMKEIKDFTEGKINIPYCNYTVQVLNKNDIYFIDYSATKNHLGDFKKIHPCDIVLINIRKEIFSYKEFIRSCVDIKFHKIVTKSIMDDNSTLGNKNYVLYFSPFDDPKIEEVDELPIAYKNYRTIYIHPDPEYVGETAEILEKFLSNYGNAGSKMVFGKALKSIKLFVITPDIGKFIEHLVRSGIAKYVMNNVSYGLRVNLESLKPGSNGEKFLNIYMDVDRDDRSLSEYNIKITRSEISVIPASKEMLLLEPMFLF